MMTNHVKKTLAAGNPTIGAFLGLGSPSVTGLMANSGLDWIVIETEHNALDTAEIEHMLMAASDTDVITIVRVPSGDQVYIQRSLDIGAMGVLVPLVRSADEATKIVAATRYPPQGNRSWGPLRSSRYTFDNDDYLNRANENMLVCLIIETLESLDELDEIASVEGIDVLTLGPWDMSLALGLDPRELPHPEIDEILERLIRVGRSCGVAVGAGAQSPEEMLKLQTMGVTFLNYGSDYGLLANAIGTGVAAFRR